MRGSDANILTVMGRIGWIDKLWERLRPRPSGDQTLLGDLRIPCPKDKARPWTMDFVGLLRDGRRRDTQGSREAGLADGDGDRNSSVADVITIALCGSRASRAFIMFSNAGDIGAEDMSGINVWIKRE